MKGLQKLNGFTAATAEEGLCVNGGQVVYHPRKEIIEPLIQAVAQTAKRIFKGIFG